MDGRSHEPAHRARGSQPLLADVFRPRDARLFADNAAINPQTGGLADLPHFAPKAKRVIYLHQSGAPSQMDLFDYKPKLATQLRPV